MWLAAKGRGSWISCAAPVIPWKPVAASGYRRDTTRKTRMDATVVFVLTICNIVPTASAASVECNC